MAKRVGSVIGIDMGRHALKAVALQRKGAGRIVLTHYAIRELTSALETKEQIATEIRALLSQLGGSGKVLAVALSGDAPLIKIVEQPDTPTHFLRNAIRLNGQALLNQDVRDYVLDCAVIPGEPLEGGRRKYLVAGAPRAFINLCAEALEKEKARVGSLQLAPVATFNAFEFSYPDVYANDAFMLVDIGHQSSTIGVGVKKELILVRNLEYGGAELIEALVRAGAQDKMAALQALEDGDDDITEAARVSLAALTREISSSIGFFEGRREENIGRIFVSGGAAASRPVLQIMAEELHMPCMAWNPLEKYEVQLNEEQQANLAMEIVNLHAACGVAAELLKEE